jgi:hypothetical protein
MVNQLIRILIVLSFVALLVACGGDNGSGIQPPESPLIGTYSGFVYDETGSFSSLLTVAITSVDPQQGGISGAVTLSGVLSCYASGNFSGSGYDEKSRTGIIESQESNSGSKALLTFSVSQDYRRLAVDGGVSKFVDSRGATCFVLKSAVLTKNVERERPRR